MASIPYCVEYTSGTLDMKTAHTALFTSRLTDFRLWLRFDSLPWIILGLAL